MGGEQWGLFGFNLAPSSSIVKYTTLSGLLSNEPLLLL
jgi:hypothetical protein